MTQFGAVNPTQRMPRCRSLDLLREDICTHCVARGLVNFSLCFDEAEGTTRRIAKNEYSVQRGQHEQNNKERQEGAVKAH